mmetsp:Transcript_14693/g.30957  ORF Transcript_14693/g.30957 Transcript_14693/m.30957 type:complete len:253 (-) Transcript_14693:148-906(-)
MSLAVPSNKMDRGSDVLKTHLSSAATLSIRQTRRGWCQECLGCEARDEYKFFKEGEKNEFATALEDSGFCIRYCFAPCHPFKMSVAEVGTSAELLSIDRPCACPVGACKCCCYQTMTVTSGGQPMGSVKEQCYCCVPRFKAFDEAGKELYKIHQPTCCGGMCINCCAEGNPCGKGCCKASFRIYPASQDKTDGDAPYIGTILKKPKSFATEVFTDANAFDLTFPESASTDEKALLIGSAMFFNANFFERENN